MRFCFLLIALFTANFFYALDVHAAETRVSVSPSLREQELPPEPRLVVEFIPREKFEAMQRETSKEGSESIEEKPSYEIIEHQELEFVQEAVQTLPDREAVLSGWPKGDLQDKLILRFDIEKRRYGRGEEIRGILHMVNSTNEPFWVRPDVESLFIWVNGQMASDERGEELQPFQFLVRGEKYLKTQKKWWMFGKKVEREDEVLTGGKSVEWVLPLNFKYPDRSKSEEIFWQTPQDVLLEAFYVKEEGDDQGTVSARPVEITIY